jgi:hypothetical protein
MCTHAGCAENGSSVRPCLKPTIAATAAIVGVGALDGAGGVEFCFVAFVTEGAARKVVVAARQGPKLGPLSAQLQLFSP